MLVSFNKGRCPDVIGYRPNHSGSILNTPGEHSDTHVLELFAAGRRERV